MPDFYLDTSALIKRYRKEKGTELIKELIEHPSPVARFSLSFLAVFELAGSVLRLAKGGQN